MIKYLIQKEFIQMRRNTFIPRLIFMFPIMIMCVMPWVLNLEVKNIRVVAVDHDRSSTSSCLIHRVEASGYFHFQGLRSSYAQALNDVEHGRADVIFSIPLHYERQRARGEKPEIQIAANAVDGTTGAMGAAYLSQILMDDAETVPFSSHYLYNPHLDYKVFMIPALMAVLIVMLCGFLPALNIVGEKESGTIEQINVTPVSKSAFILAKLIPYWVIGLVVLTICFVLSWAIYGIVPGGSVGLLYLASLLLALTCSGLGLVVSNYSDTMQQAMFVMWFFVVCMMLLSGLFTPVSSMPWWAQQLTLFNPIRHYIDAMRTIFVRGGSLASVSIQFIALTVFALVMDVWAVRSYRKRG